LGLGRLKDFVVELTSHANRSEGLELQREARPLLVGLVATDDWLPEQFCQADSDAYRQFLLHCDPLQRFSIVSFAWGPGQSTPVHDHGTWGLIGMLRGAELSTAYDVSGGRLIEGLTTRLNPGDVESVSPEEGDVHRVRNAYGDRTSVSIHVYGANIGSVDRRVYAMEGNRKPFRSGYSNDWLPNLWDRSVETAG